MIVTSRRTSAEMTKTIYDNRQDTAIIWQNNKKNPYTFALKYSDFFIVSSDSTSMISEAAITGKPVYVEQMSNKRSIHRFKKFYKLFQALGIIRNLENKIEHWTYNGLDEVSKAAIVVKEKMKKNGII